MLLHMLLQVYSNNKKKHYNKLCVDYGQACYGILSAIKTFNILSG